MEARGAGEADLTAWIVKRELSGAVHGVIDRCSHYIGITARPLVNTKPDNCVKAMREDICLGGGNPGKLAAIKVYEATR